MTSRQPGDSSELQQNFGSKLRAMREASGISLRQTAKNAGISPTFLSDIEHGRRMPRRTIVLQLADAIGANIEELLKLDPREGLNDILATVTSHPEARAVLAKLCRSLDSGKVSPRDLEQIIREWS